MRREIDTFIQYLQSERSASPHTVDAYRRDLDQFADFISRELGSALTVHDLTHLHIRRYLAHLHQGLE
jgi:site-specific recombinase XerD